MVTGVWSEGAIKEAKKLSDVVEVWPDSGKKYTTIPDPSTWKVDKEAAFFFYVDNETVHGVEFNNFPHELVKDMILVSDMSSNFASRPIDWEKFGVVFAGA